ncbi:hypothetical protein ARMGADRAFT_671290 [Armillaria gallica]|uniref:Uncharacterized protein n=1 Tax=Armillaria gallica TaxID=47427 RepID=A0A2H3CKB5_ARMGA|nr:hypothetical protein ARMGADRAFT_671290 [Armillaria gallica]
MFIHAVKRPQFISGETVGRLVATEAAKYLQPCILEMGGNALRSDTSTRRFFFRLCIEGQTSRSARRQLELSSHNLANFTKANTQSLGSSTIISVPRFGSCHRIDLGSTRGAQVLVGDMLGDGAPVQLHVIYDA